jgi:hypothetical protein
MNFLKEKAGKNLSRLVFTYLDRLDRKWRLIRLKRFRKIFSKTSTSQIATP